MDNIKKELNDKNWMAVEQFINSLAVQLSETKSELLDQRKNIADLKQEVNRLKGELLILRTMGIGSGPTE